MGAVFSGSESSQDESMNVMNSSAGQLVSYLNLVVDARWEYCLLGLNDNREVLRVSSPAPSVFADHPVNEGRLYFMAFERSIALMNNAIAAMDEAHRRLEGPCSLPPWTRAGLCVRRILRDEENPGDDVPKHEYTVEFCNYIADDSVEADDEMKEQHKEADEAVEPLVIPVYGWDIIYSDQFLAEIPQFRGHLNQSCNDPAFQRLLRYDGVKVARPDEYLLCFMGLTNAGPEADPIDGVLLECVEVPAQLIGSFSPINGGNFVWAWARDEHKGPQSAAIQKLKEVTDGDEDEPGDHIVFRTRQLFGNVETAKIIASAAVYRMRGTNPFLYLLPFNSDECTETSYLMFALDVNLGRKGG